MRVRVATPGDAEAVALLHAESWRSAYAAAMPAEFLAGPVVDDRRRAWASRLAAEWTGGGPRPYTAVAEVAGRIAAFVCLVDQAPGEVLLDNLHVRPGRTGGGIGGLLLRHALAWTAARRPGCRLTLWVLAGNEGARRFYERHGASPGRRRSERFDAGFEAEEVEYAWPAGALAGRDA